MRGVGRTVRILALVLLGSSGCGSSPAGSSAGQAAAGVSAGSAGVLAMSGSGAAGSGAGVAARGGMSAAGRGGAAGGGTGAAEAGAGVRAGTGAQPSAGASGNGSGAAGATGSAAGGSGSNAAGSGGSAGNTGASGSAGSSGSAGASGNAGASAAAGSGAAACAAPAPGSKGKNPLFIDAYTADPGVLVHDCTFYIHCGHDEGQTGFVMREWFVLASRDMVSWTKKVAMDLSVFSWADANAWAGQMVERDGKFYWYVPVNQRGVGMAIGVAVGDSPEGPFKDAIGRPLVDDAFEMSNVGFRTPSDTPFTIDPTVLVDDDGQAYLHYGGFSRMMVAKLGRDMTSIEGKMKEVTPQGFFEAPYLVKRGGTYYEFYAAGTNPATIDYATSTSPLGPWKYGGRILDALPGVPGQDAPTSHPAVAELAGQWYLVYHLSNGPNGGGTYKREVALDKLAWPSDGTIPKLTRTNGVSF